MLYRKELEQIDLSTSDPQAVDMMQDVLTTGIELEVTGTFTISGGSTSGTVLAETPHNLIEWVMCERDSDEFVGRIPGQMLAALQRYTLQNPPRFTTIPDGDAAATAVSARYFIPFSNPLIVNPFETVGYFAPAASTFKLHVKRIATVDIDSFTTGSDRTGVLTVPQVRVFQHYAKTPTAYRPQYLPRYSVITSDAITASQDAFRFNMEARTNIRLAATLLQESRGGLGVEDIVGNVTLRSDRDIMIDGIPAATLRAREDLFYPGIDGSAGTTQVGTYQGMPLGYTMLNWVSDHVGGRWGQGRTRQAPAADKLRHLRLELGVTRTSGTELIRALNMGLETVPGWTRL